MRSLSRVGCSNQQRGREESGVLDATRYKAAPVIVASKQSSTVNSAALDFSCPGHRIGTGWSVFICPSHPHTDPQGQAWRCAIQRHILPINS